MWTPNVKQVKTDIYFSRHADPSSFHGAGEQAVLFPLIIKNTTGIHKEILRDELPLSLKHFTM